MQPNESEFIRDALLKTFSALVEAGFRPEVVLASAHATVLSEIASIYGFQVAKERAEQAASSIEAVVQENPLIDQPAAGSA